MTKVTPLPHRHGRIQVYFRRDKGWRIALPSTIGSDEFRAAYQAAITSQSVVKREQLSPAPSGRIAALVEAGCQKKGPGRAGPARRLPSAGGQFPASAIVIIGCVFLVTSTLPPFGDKIRPGSPQPLNSA